jgi:hypothetical protein
MMGMGMGAVGAAPPPPLLLPLLLLLLCVGAPLRSVQAETEQLFGRRPDLRGAAHARRVQEEDRPGDCVGYSCEGHVNRLNGNASAIECPEVGCSTEDCCTDPPELCGMWRGCADSSLPSRDQVMCHPDQGCTVSLCCIEPVYSCHDFDCSAYGRPNPTNYGCGNLENGEPECDPMLCCVPFDGTDSGFGVAERCDLGNDLCGDGLVCNPYTFPSECTPPPDTEGYYCEFDYAGCDTEYGRTGLSCQSSEPDGTMMCLQQHHHHHHQFTATANSPSNSCSSRRSQAFACL